MVEIIRSKNRLRTAVICTLTVAQFGIAGSIDSSGMYKTVGENMAEKLKQKTTLAAKEIGISEGVKLFTQNEGFKTLSGLEHKNLVSILKSKELLDALTFPDKLGEKENLVVNLSKLGKNNNFLSVFGEAYNSKDGMYTRILVGDIYNSSVGEEVMKELMNVNMVAAFPGLMKVLYVTIASKTKISEEEKRISNEHFDYSEEKIEMDSIANVGYRHLKGYLETGSKDALDEFKKFAAENPLDVELIFRTQEARAYFLDVLKSDNRRGRLAETFNSDMGRKILSPVLEHPEGINLIGHLWNSNQGRSFISNMVTSNINVLATWKTLKLIMDKQGEYKKAHDYSHKMPE